MKPKLLLKIADVEHTGEFVFEYPDIKTLKLALENALPWLSANGVFVAEQLSLNALTHDGVKFQTQKEFPYHWKITKCLDYCKRHNLTFSSYSATPGHGYIFKLL